MPIESISIDISLLEELAPFSIIFDENGRVVFLSSRVKYAWGIKCGEDEAFELVNKELLLSRPFESSVTAELLPNLTELNIHLEISSNRGRVIRGQLHEHGDSWLFSGFPMVSTVVQLEDMGILLSDLPLSTGLGELLIANELNEVSLKESTESAKKLVLANNDLERTLESFSKFVPNDFLETVGISSPMDAELGCHVESRKVVMFADLRGFTAISEGLSAEGIFQVINQYLNCTVPCIESNGGFVVHFLGDGIMALFPSGDGSAVTAAVQMQRALRMCQGEHSPYDFVLSMSIGIHEGPVALGVVGHETRWDASIISDAVNICARIEAKTRILGGEILVSSEYLNSFEAQLSHQLRSLGAHEIRGRTGLVELTEVLDSLDEESIQSRLETQADFESGVASFGNGDFYEAMSSFGQVLAKDSKDKAAQYYLALISKNLTTNG